MDWYPLLHSLRIAAIKFVKEGTTTGIDNVNRETITNNRYYDLQGRKVLNPAKGLYIINGKKIFVK